MLRVGFCRAVSICRRSYYPRVWRASPRAFSSGADRVGTQRWARGRGQEWDGQSSSEQKTHANADSGAKGGGFRWGSTLLGAVGCVSVLALAYQGSVVEYVPGKATFRSFDRQIFNEDVQQLLRKVYGHAAISLLVSSAVCVVTLRLAAPALRQHVVKAVLGAQACVWLSIYSTQHISFSEQPGVKYASYLIYSLAVGAAAASWSCVPGVAGLMIRKTLITYACTTMGVCLIVMNSPSDSFLWLAGPVSIPLSVLAARGACMLIFPRTRIIYNAAMYLSALGLGGICLIDTTARLDHAEESCKDSFNANKLGVEHSHTFDPVNEAMGLYADAINVSKRVKELLAMVF
jgi:FtsH-binding integral membrane protein